MSTLNVKNQFEVITNTLARMHFIQKIPVKNIHPGIFKFIM